MATTWILTDERYLGQRMPAALLAELRARGRPTRILVADRLLVETTAPEKSPWAGLAAGDVVVARTRNQLALALLRAAELPGVAVLPRWSRVAAVRNKVRAAQLLAAAGIPMPQTFLADTPAVLARVAAEHFPLLLKPHLGDNGAGILLVRTPGELAGLAWDHGLVLAQRFVDADSIDVKVYVAGDDVWAVRRRSPLVPEADPGSERIPVTPRLREIAETCGALFDLRLFGVDVLESSTGPLVVDVNEFPNYTGIPEAPRVVADVVVARLRPGVEEVAAA